MNIHKANNYYIVVAIWLVKLGWILLSHIFIIIVFSTNHCLLSFIYFLLSIQLSVLICLDNSGNQHRFSTWYSSWDRHSILHYITWFRLSALAGDNPCLILYPFQLDHHHKLKYNNYNQHKTPSYTARQKGDPPTVVPVK